MADHLRTDLDQLLLQARQRPVLDWLGRRQRAQEIAEIVGQRIKLARALTANQNRGIWMLCRFWRRSAFLPGVASEKGKAQTGADLLRAGQRQLRTFRNVKFELDTRLKKTAWLAHCRLVSR